MKPIKYRWRMWKIYTDKTDKAIHAVVAIFFSVAAIVFISDFSWLNTIVGVGYLGIGYSIIMKDVWGNAYQKTETLRRLGAHTAEALHAYTFVKMANVRGTYSIEPDLPAIDPDAIEDDIYTDEIVIRRGMTTDDEPVTAYQIPEDLPADVVVGLLEFTKLQYTNDELAGNHDH